MEILFNTIVKYIVFNIFLFFKKQYYNLQLYQYNMFDIISGVKAFISGLQMQQKQSETAHKIVPGNIFKNFFKFVLEIVNSCLFLMINKITYIPLKLLIDISFNYNLTT